MHFVKTKPFTAFNILHFEIIVYVLLKSDGIYKVMPSSTIFPTLNLSKISEDSLLSIYVSATCMYLYFYWHTNYHFKCVQTCTNKCKIHCQKCI